MFYSCLLGRGSPASTAGCTPSPPWLLTAADCRCDVQLPPHQSASTHLLNSCWMWNSSHLAHPVIQKMVLCDDPTCKTVTVTQGKMFMYFNINFKSLKGCNRKAFIYFHESILHKRPKFVCQQAVANTAEDGSSKTHVYASCAILVLTLLIISTLGPQYKCSSVSKAFISYTCVLLSKATVNSNRTYKMYSQESECF